MDDVRTYFRPEFINRIDEIIVFNPLSREAINEILDKIIKELEDRLTDINIHIELTNSAREELINEGYDINYGARPLKRLVSRIIETDLAKLIISCDIKVGDNILIDYKDTFIISKKEDKNN